MNSYRHLFARFLIVGAAILLLVGPAQANNWDLVQDWILGEPDATFGPGDPSGTVWQVKEDDTANPAPPFIDTTDNYRPQPSNDGIFISGYAHATRALAKMYGTPGPVIIDPADQIFQPGNWNADPGAGSIDQGDLFGINGGCCGPGSAVNIWFVAPQDGEYSATVDFYSAGTAGGVDMPVDFGIRNGPALPLLTGNFGANISGPIPAYDAAVGREFVTYTLPPTMMTAGQHIMLRAIAGGSHTSGNRNGWGMSSFAVTLIPEPSSAGLSLLGCLGLLALRRRS